MRHIFSRNCLLLLGIALLALPADRVTAGVTFEIPTGGWTYSYEGEDADAGANNDFDSLDGSWDHENGSDAWDGSTILDGNPGGVMVLDDPVDGTIFLRMVDTGDPRDLGIADPSNRKYFFGHDIGAEGAPDNVIDAGVTLSFRARIPTDGPLAGITPGDGYHNHNGGKSVFTISQADPASTISFFLVNEEEDETGFEGPGLGMNSLDSNVISGGVDWQGDDGTPNLFTLNDNDPTKWHEFWVNIFQPGLENGTHTVVVYADGDVENPQFFDVTAGDGRDYGINYITMGLGSTPQSGAVDVDFFSWSPGLLEPVAKGGEVIPGDATGDGKVDAMDLNILGGNWQMGVDGGISDGDFNVDGFVNAQDLNILGGNWQFGVAAPLNASVPEPTSHTLTLVMMCFVGFMIRRRKK